MNRGVGKQIIFEDVSDYLYFLKLLRQHRDDLGYKVVAYCLMPNHFHLLIEDCNNNISLIGKKLAFKYATYFNKKYERVGHLYQDRFKSVLVNDDSQLLNTFRYIHQNPQVAGICEMDKYRWSSFCEYRDNSFIINSTTMYSFFTDTADLLAFIQKETPWHELVDGHYKGDFADLIEEIKTCIGIDPGQIKCQQKTARNNYLRELKRFGLTLRDIEKITGVSRSTISRL